MRKQILISLIIISSCLTMNAQWNGTNPVWTTSNVGIGTGYAGVGIISPVEKLTIGEMGGNFAVQDRRTSTTEKYTSGYKFYDYNGESASILLEHNSYFGNTTRALNFFVNGAERVRINANGNVGIGTTNPDAKLVVNGDAKIKQNLFISGSSGGYTTGDNPVLYFGVNSDFAKISVPFGDKMILSSYHGYTFNTSNNGSTPVPVFTIGITGNVGIGTTNPVAPLTVYGKSIFFPARIGSGDARSFVVDHTASNPAFISNDYPVVLKTGGGDQPLILDASRIGIGTSNPDEKLTVKGKIHTQEVRVDMNGPLVPDYVFANDYKLKSLQQVEDYIKENSHLPEIPSAKEIEKNGLMLAEMNMSLLKKIEELTLYAIEQERKTEKLNLYIIEQNKIISEQNRRLDKLER